MPNFYTSVILLINRSKEIGEKQFPDHTHLLFLALEGGQNSPYMHVPLYFSNLLYFQIGPAVFDKNIIKVFFFLLVAIAFRISHGMEIF